jgi:NADH-ubiquinone oxidoreductase chain 6
LLITHPLAIGIILMFQTLTICLLTSFFAQTYWFSYVLFLIFLGGILVLFIYVTSLASNEIFSFSIRIFIFSTIIISLFLLLSFFLDKIIIINYFKNLELININFIKSFIDENNLILNKLYNFPINFITVMLIIYLFLTLIAAVKITNVFEGPLRPSFSN